MLSILHVIKEQAILDLLDKLFFYDKNQMRLLGSCKKSKLFSPFSKVHNEEDILVHEAL